MTDGAFAAWFSMRKIYAKSKSVKISVCVLLLKTRAKGVELSSASEERRMSDLPFPEANTHTARASIKAE